MKQPHQAFREPVLRAVGKHVWDADRVELSLDIAPRAVVVIVTTYDDGAVR